MWPCKAHSRPAVGLQKDTELNLWCVADAAMSSSRQSESRAQQFCRRSPPPSLWSLYMKQHNGACGGLVGINRADKSATTRARGLIIIILNQIKLVAQFVVVGVGVHWRHSRDELGRFWPDLAELQAAGGRGRDRHYHYYCYHCCRCRCCRSCP